MVSTVMELWIHQKSSRKIQYNFAELNKDAKILISGNILEFIFITALINTGLADIPTQGEREKILDFHNWLRANVIPSATNMRRMVYSKQLEDLADKWVSKCHFVPPDKHQYPEYFNVGYNLGLFSGPEPSIVQLAQEWANESINYDIISDTYNSTKSCWPYTQV
ncbi:hypothetical protein ACTXT7_005548 [Hymenolepis weldensis]